MNVSENPCWASYNRGLGPTPSSWVTGGGWSFAPLTSSQSYCCSYSPGSHPSRTLQSRVKTAAPRGPLESIPNAERMDLSKVSHKAEERTHKLPATLSSDLWPYGNTPLSESWNSCLHLWFPFILPCFLPSTFPPPFLHQGLLLPHLSQCVPVCGHLNDRVCICPSPLSLCTLL